MFNGEYDPLYEGFSEKKAGDVLLFGPRMARAIMLCALVSGDQFVKDGLYISYRELKTSWPQAMMDGLFGSRWRCGLVTFLRLIEERKDQIHQVADFDDLVNVIKNLNHQVYGDLQRITKEQEVSRKPVGRENEGVLSAKCG